MTTKIIPLDLYKRGIIVFVGTNEELESYFAKDMTALNNIRESLLDFDEYTEAMTISLDTDVLIFAHEPIDTPTLVHELLHAVNVLMQIISAQHIENDEPYAYLLEYLFREATSSDVVSQPRSSEDSSKHSQASRNAHSRRRVA